MTIQHCNIKLYDKAKRLGYQIIERKDFDFKINNNSADYIMPNFVRGCETAKCAYCYVARHNDFGNPIKLDTRLDLYVEKCAEFYETLPPKIANQQDAFKHVLEIGECSDLLNPGLIDYTNYLIRNIPWQSGFKTTFATKLANKYSVSKLEDGRFDKHRIRVSLMPQKVSDILEPGTSKIKDRIEAIYFLHEKGFQVHINFAPVIMYNTWVQDYLELFKSINNFLDTLDVATKTKIKNQLACEIIFLTHHPKLHESNLKWSPEAESILWQPDNQEFKTNKRGGSNILRYKLEIKKPAMKVLFGALKHYMPYCTVRYAF